MSDDDDYFGGLRTESPLNKTGRKSGFYWVTPDFMRPIKMTIGQYNQFTNRWFVIGFSVEFEDSDFIEIDEHPIEREVKPLPEYGRDTIPDVPKDKLRGLGEGLK